jgi:hypothetical protein
MSKKIARRIRRMETMLEVWERLNASCDIPSQYANELMLEIPVLPKIKDLEFRKLCDHYELLKVNIGEAAKENQQEIFLIPANIDKMTQALPLQEEILWREARKRDLSAAFTNFVDDHLDLYTNQAGSNHQVHSLAHRHTKERKRGRKA